jgi:hypothetical protein
MNSMRLRLPSYEYSLTLALSLLKGEGISFENAIRISTTVNSGASIKAT